MQNQEDLSAQDWHAILLTSQQPDDSKPKALNRVPMAQRIVVLKSLHLHLLGHVDSNLLTNQLAETEEYLLPQYGYLSTEYCKTMLGNFRYLCGMSTNDSIDAKVLWG